MSLESSKKVLKLAGFLTIVGGILAILGGLLSTFMGGVASQAPEIQTDAKLAEGASVLLTAGVIEAIAGLVSLFEGIFTYQAGKNGTHTGAAYVFAFIGLTSSILQAIDLFAFQTTRPTSTIISVVLAVVLNIGILMAASKVRKEYRK